MTLIRGRAGQRIPLGFLPVFEFGGDVHVRNGAGVVRPGIGIVVQTDPALAIPEAERLPSDRRQFWYEPHPDELADSSRSLIVVWRHIGPDGVSRWTSGGAEYVVDGDDGPSPDTYFTTEGR